MYHKYLKMELSIYWFLAMVIFFNEETQEAAITPGVIGEEHIIAPLNENIGSANQYLNQELAESQLWNTDKALMNDGKLLGREMEEEGGENFGKGGFAGHRENEFDGMKLFGHKYGVDGNVADIEEPEIPGEIRQDFKGNPDGEKQQTTDNQWGDYDWSSTNRLKREIDLEQIKNFDFGGAVTTFGGFYNNIHHRKNSNMLSSTNRLKREIEFENEGWEGGRMVNGEDGWGAARMINMDYNGGEWNDYAWGDYGAANERKKRAAKMKDVNQWIMRGISHVNFADIDWAGQIARAIAKWNRMQVAANTTNIKATAEELPQTGNGKAKADALGDILNSGPTTVNAITTDPNFDANGQIVNNVNWANPDEKTIPVSSTDGTAKTTTNSQKDMDLLDVITKNPIDLQILTDTTTRIEIQPTNLVGSTNTTLKNFDSKNVVGNRQVQRPDTGLANWDANLQTSPQQLDEAATWTDNGTWSQNSNNLKYGKFWADYGQNKDQFDGKEQQLAIGDEQSINYEDYNYADYGWGAKNRKKRAPPKIKNVNEWILKDIRKVNFADDDWLGQIAMAIAVWNQRQKADKAKALAKAWETSNIGTTTNEPINLLPTTELNFPTDRVPEVNAPGRKTGTSTNTIPVTEVNVPTSMNSNQVIEVFPKNTKQFFSSTHNLLADIPRTTTPNIPISMNVNPLVIVPPTLMTTLPTFNQKNFNDIKLNTPIHVPVIRDENPGNNNLENMTSSNNIYQKSPFTKTNAAPDTTEPMPAATSNPYYWFPKTELSNAKLDIWTPEYKGENIWGDYKWTDNKVAEKEQGAADYNGLSSIAYNTGDYTYYGDYQKGDYGGVNQAQATEHGTGEYKTWEYEAVGDYGEVKQAKINDYGDYGPNNAGDYLTNYEGEYGGVRQAKATDYAYQTVDYAGNQGIPTTTDGAVKRGKNANNAEDNQNGQWIGDFVWGNYGWAGNTNDRRKREVENEGWWDIRQLNQSPNDTQVEGERRKRATIEDLNKWIMSDIGKVNFADDDWLGQIAMAIVTWRENAIAGNSLPVLAGDNTQNTMNDGVNQGAINTPIPVIDEFTTNVLRSNETSTSSPIQALISDNSAPSTATTNTPLFTTNGNKPWRINGVPRGLIGPWNADYTPGDYSWGKPPLVDNQNIFNGDYNWLEYGTGNLLDTGNMGDYNWGAVDYLDPNNPVPDPIEPANQEGNGGDYGWETNPKRMDGTNLFNVDYGNTDYGNGKQLIKGNNDQINADYPWGDYGTNAPNGEINTDYQWREQQGIRKISKDGQQDVKIDQNWQDNGWEAARKSGRGKWIGDFNWGDYGWAGNTNDRRKREIENEGWWDLRKLSSTQNTENWNDFGTHGERVERAATNMKIAKAVNDWVLRDVEGIDFAGDDWPGQIARAIATWKKQFTGMGSLNNNKAPHNHAFNGHIDKTNSKVNIETTTALTNEVVDVTGSFTPVNGETNAITQGNIASEATNNGLIAETTNISFQQATNNPNGPTENLNVTLIPLHAPATLQSPATDETNTEIDAMAEERTTTISSSKIDVGLMKSSGIRQINTLPVSQMDVQKVKNSHLGTSTQIPKINVSEDITKLTDTLQKIKQLGLGNDVPVQQFEAGLDQNEMDWFDYGGFGEYEGGVRQLNAGGPDLPDGLDAVLGKVEQNEVDYKWFDYGNGQQFNDNDAPLGIKNVGGNNNTEDLVKRLGGDATQEDNELDYNGLEGKVKEFIKFGGSYFGGDEQINEQLRPGEFGWGDYGKTNRIKRTSGYTTNVINKMKNNPTINKANLDLENYEQEYLKENKKQFSNHVVNQLKNGINDGRKTRQSWLSRRYASQISEDKFSIRRNIVADPEGNWWQKKQINGGGRDEGRDRRDVFGHKDVGHNINKTGRRISVPDAHFRAHEFSSRLLGGALIPGEQRHEFSSELLSGADALGQPGHEFSSWLLRGQRHNSGNFAAVKPRNDLVEDNRAISSPFVEKNEVKRSTHYLGASNKDQTQDQPTNFRASYPLPNTGRHPNKYHFKTSTKGNLGGILDIFNTKKILHNRDLFMKNLINILMKIDTKRGYIVDKNL